MMTSILLQFMTKALIKFNTHNKHTPEKGVEIQRKRRRGK